MHETSKPQIDELADWQLRILSEYSQAGTSLMEQAVTIWLPWLAGGLGGAIGAIVSGQPVVGGILGAFVIVMLVMATVPLFHRTSEIRNRTLIIEDALTKLSEGKALDRAVFAKVLEDIHHIDKESKVVAVIPIPWPKQGS